MFDDGAEAAKQRIELAGQVIEVFREAGVAGDAFTVTAVLGFLAARAFASKASRSRRSSSSSVINH